MTITSAEFINSIKDATPTKEHEILFTGMFVGYALAKGQSTLTKKQASDLIDDINGLADIARKKG